MSVTWLHEDWDIPESDPFYGEALRLKTLSLNTGNPWLWCTVKVTVRYRTLYAHEFLGGCSFESKQEFLLDEYFPDMTHQALAKLNDKVALFQRPCCRCVCNEDTDVDADESEAAT